MVQKRPASERLNKYKAKISGDIAKQRYEATKDLSVNSQRGYFAKAEKLEVQVKSIVDGVPSIQQHFYIAYAEEMAKKHTQGEWDIVFNKWKSRNLSSALLVSIALLIVPQYTAPTARYEYYNVNDDGQRFAFAINWLCQTFTIGTVGPNENFNVSFVRLKLFRKNNPGTVTVSIQGVDVANKPDGVDVAVGTIDGNSVTAATGGAWYDIVLSSFELQASTQYAIVIRALTGDGSNYISWRIDEGGATYLGGKKGASPDSGVTWSMVDIQDFMFEVWGTPIFS